MNDGRSMRVAMKGEMTDPRTTNDPHTVLVLQHHPQLLPPILRRLKHFFDHHLHVVCAAAKDMGLERVLAGAGSAGVGSDATIKELRDDVKLLDRRCLDDVLDEVLSMALDQCWFCARMLR